MVVTVKLNDQEEALLQERIDYLQQQRRGSRVTKSEAIRHAITQTNYKKRTADKKESE